jgi:hypothetical protein
LQHALTLATPRAAFLRRRQRRESEPPQNRAGQKISYQQESPNEPASRARKRPANRLTSSCKSSETAALRRLSR